MRHFPFKAGGRRFRKGEIIMAYQFNWDGFSEAAWKDCDRQSRIDFFTDTWVGNVRVGDICFDLVFRCFDADMPLTLTYDAYVGGIDDGYGYGENGYPYTEADGGTLCDFYDWSYEVFKEMAETELAGFIEERHLEDKASQPLHIW